MVKSSLAKMLAEKESDVIGVPSVLTNSNMLLCELAQMKFTVELDDCFAIGLWFGRCLRYSQQRIQIAVFLSRASVRAY